MIAVSDSVIAASCPNLNSNSDCVWINVLVKGKRPVYIGCFYRPPDGNTTSIQELRESLEKISKNHEGKTNLHVMVTDL